MTVTRETLEALIAHGVGNRLRQARLELSKRTPEKDVTKAEMARRVGETEMTYGRWDRGLNPPSLADIVRLAAITGEDPRSLSFGSAEEVSALVEFARRELAERGNATPSAPATSASRLSRVIRKAVGKPLPSKKKASRRRRASDG